MDSFGWFFASGKVMASTDITCNHRPLHGLRDCPVGVFRFCLAESQCSTEVALRHQMPVSWTTNQSAFEHQGSGFFRFVVGAYGYSLRIYREHTPGPGMSS